MTLASPTSQHNVGRASAPAGPQTQRRRQTKSAPSGCRGLADAGAALSATRRQPGPEPCRGLLAALQHLRARRPNVGARRSRRHRVAEGWRMPAPHCLQLAGNPAPNLAAACWPRFSTCGPADPRRRQTKSAPSGCRGLADAGAALMATCRRVAGKQRAPRGLGGRRGALWCSLLLAVTAAWFRSWCRTSGLP